MCGIYVIKNLASGKVYVGQTINFHNRWKSHVKAVKAGLKTKLYDAMRSYGIDSFMLTPVVLCAKEELNAVEAEWIARLNALEDGYNMIADCNHARTLSKETRKRMSDAQKGRKLTQETRDKISAAGVGRRLSAETIEKVKVALTGRKRTRLQRDKISMSQQNRSDEWRERQSKSQTGKTASDEAKAKMSMLRKGVRKSDEHKAKIAEAARNASPEIREKRAAAIRAGHARRKQFTPEVVA